MRKKRTTRDLKQTDLARDVTNDDTPVGNNQILNINKCIKQQCKERGEVNFRQCGGIQVAALFPPDIRAELGQRRGDRQTHATVGCLTIQALINNLPANILVDTGSDISAVSAQFVNNNPAYFKGTPALPVNKIEIKSATGDVRKVTKQIYVMLEVDKIEWQIPALVIKGLIYDVIIGIDTLGLMRATIDVGQKSLTFIHNGEQHSVGLNQEDVKTEGVRQPIEIRRPEAKFVEPDPEEKEKVYMNAKENKILTKLIKEYEAIFSGNPSVTTVHEHEIKVAEPEKFTRKVYPIPIKHQEAVREEIQRMLELGIIERSTSSFLNPLVVVRKKSGEIRLCLDMRNLNSLVDKEYDCAPTAEELFWKCEGARYLTKLDLTSSFWQIPIRKQDRKYTAFMYQHKCYHHKVVPFGLSTSLAAIVRCLEKALGPELEPFTMVFVDDILVISRTFEEHMEHLRQVFDCFRKANLTLNLKKCEWVKSSMKFLGHIISEEGIRTDPEKIRSITEFPTPRDKKGLRAFLGLTGYYRRFSDRYAECTVPLLELLKKETKWKWGPEYEKALKEVKSLFHQNMKLYHPQQDRTYVVYTDASEYAIGGVLYQRDSNGELWVIAYTNRTLKGAECHYCTSEKEILAIVNALQKFRHYLYGTHFEIHTDNQALSFILKCRLANSRLTRWILAIEEYSFTIKYCRGTENTIADILSRYAPQAVKEEEYEATKDELKVLAIKYQVTPQVQDMLRNLAAHQGLDPGIRRIKENLLVKENPRYQIKNDILYKLMKGEWKIVLSHEMLVTLGWACHQTMAHASSRKCCLALQEDFIANNMHRKLSLILKRCMECQTARSPNMHTYVPMQNVIAGERGDMVAIDFLGPLPRAVRDKRHIVVCIDVFTKNVRLFAVSRPTTRAVLNVILKQYIPKHGRVKSILSDQGKQFQNRLWAETLGQHHIKPILTSIRRPQGNLAERVNKELGKLFRIYCHENHAIWPEYLPFFEEAINGNYHHTTGFTPIELESGRAPRRFWHRYMDKPVTQNLPIPLQCKIGIAKERIIRKGARRAERFNRTHKLKHFAEGERVLIRANPVGSRPENKAAKFYRLYKGPYVLQRQLAPHTFIVVDPANNDRVIGKYHAASMRKLYE